MSEPEDFQLANRAFELMTLDERERVLREFARLRYPSIGARFFEAVHVVIKSKAKRQDHATGDRNLQIWIATEGIQEALALLQGEAGKD